MLTVNLPDLLQGDTWPGIVTLGPVLVAGQTPAAAVAACRLWFFRPRKGTMAYELVPTPGASQGLIVIDDPLLWRFSVPAQALPLAIGLWGWCLEVTDVDGGRFTPYGGWLSVRGLGGALTGGAPAVAVSGAAVTLGALPPVPHAVAAQLTAADLDRLHSCTAGVTLTLPLIDEAILGRRLILYKVTTAGVGLVASGNDLIVDAGNVRNDTAETEAFIELIAASLGLWRPLASRGTWGSV